MFAMFHPGMRSFRSSDGLLRAGKGVNFDLILLRVVRITQLRWETGPVVPQELQRSLSAREMELFNAYDRILTDYSQVCS